MESLQRSPTTSRPPKPKPLLNVTPHIPQVSSLEKYGACAALVLSGVAFTALQFRGLTLKPSIGSTAQHQPFLEKGNLGSNGHDMSSDMEGPNGCFSFACWCGPLRRLLSTPSGPRDAPARENGTRNSLSDDVVFLDPSGASISNSGVEGSAAWGWLQDANVSGAGSCCPRPCLLLLPCRIDRKPCLATFLF